jgi:hypothetical protein
MRLGSYRATSRNGPWTLEPVGGQMTALSGDKLDVLDHDVLTLAEMAFSIAPTWAPFYGYRNVLTPMAYDHAEVIREGQAVQVEPTGCEGLVRHRRRSLAGDDSERG